MPSQAPCRIFIRDCYIKAEEVVWQEAADRQARTGVIFSGQPGIGTNILVSYLNSAYSIYRKDILPLVPPCPSPKDEATHSTSSNSHHFLTLLG